MKQGMSIMDFVTELKRQTQDDIRKDYGPDVRSMKMTTEGKLVIEDIKETVENPLDITPWAHNQIGTVTDIPGRYYDTLMQEDPSLLAHNVNTRLGSLPERMKKKAYPRLVRVMDNKVRAFLSPQYRIIDNVLVAGAAQQAMMKFPDLKIVSANFSDDFMFLKASLPTLKQDVMAVGDTVEGGIIISNSETGKGTVTIRPYLTRLACLNGMVCEDREFGMNKKHLGRRNIIDVDFTVLSDDTRMEADKVLAKAIGETVEAVLDGTQFELAVDKMKAAAGIRITSTDIPKTVEFAGRDLGLRKTELDGITNFLIRGTDNTFGQDLTMYGLSQAITRYSAEDEVNYERATELEQIGWDCLNVNERMWANWNRIAA